VSLRHADLQRRFGLSAEVPCVGTDLQGRCKLLGDARDAQAMLPSVDGQIAALRDRQHAAEAERAGLCEELRPLAGVAELRNEAERRLEVASARSSSLARLAAREGEMRQAQAALVAIEAELGVLPDDAPAATDEEAAERADIEAARARLAAERNRLSTDRDASIGRIEGAVAALPPAFDRGRLEAARRASIQADAGLRSAEQAHLAAVRIQERRTALQVQHARASGEAVATDARATEVESELSGWTLLARCLSNDGVIALDIDDAGPTLAGLANDLLLACYGRRFTLEIRTQVATAKGEMREGFDIVVHDGEGGESKSVALLSGGERVWISCRSRHEIHYAENQDMPSPRSGRRLRPCNCAAGTCEAMRHNTAGSGTMNPDARGGKSLSLMSGGERTFIDACLTRAIALYLAQNTGRRFDTLFSDEADGPLDPEHKRMFMAMKREVLRLGGYRQEFFITQTPHLATMADAVIDLDAMQAEPRAGIGAAHR
jgi:exonuclease SbcC